MTRDEQPRGRPRHRDHEPVLPERARDDSDVGWGEDGDRADQRDADWYRREKPPHHE